MQTQRFVWLIEAVIGFPLAAFAIIGFCLVLGLKLSERLMAWLVRGSMFISLIGMAPLVYAFARGGFQSHFLFVGNFFEIPGYAFDLGFIVDTPSVVTAVLTLVLSSFAARFAQTYVHQEPGFGRFFSLLSLFVGAMLFAIFAATYDQLFIGWELVGLASAFLVAYFHNRTGPVRQGLRVFITYRISDIGFLLAAAGMHHYLSLNHIPLPGELSGMLIQNLPPTVLTLLALGIVTGAMGKAAQLPLGGWLPRAMEGPAPSSAIFYGGLSVHAGIYLLIRSYPILEKASYVRGVLILAGAATFVYAALVVRVQTDVKSSFAHATMAQLGLMVVEVALGYTGIALVHLCAHCTLRTWQLLRAQNIFHEAAEIHASLAANGPAPALSHPAQSLFLYRAALARFSIDTLTERYLLYPLIAFGRVLEAFERRLDAALCAFPDAAAPLESPEGEDEDSAEAPELTGPVKITKTRPREVEHRS